MRRISSIAWVGFFVVALTALSFAQEKAAQTLDQTQAQPQAQPQGQAEHPKTFGVYIDKRSPENHYISAGWMGDYGDVKLNDECMDNPHSGTTCLQFTYSANKSQGQGYIGRIPLITGVPKRAVLTLPA
jgi:hypothetical protein